MQIDFRYIKELEAFIEILLLGNIFSVFMVYTIEILKRNINVRAKYAWIFCVISFVLSFMFGIFWKMTFAGQSMSISFSLWMSLCIFLGANGFYKTLKKSNGLLGKSVRSYEYYVRQRSMGENSPDRETENPVLREEEKSSDKNIQEPVLRREEAKPGQNTAPDEIKPEAPIPGESVFVYYTVQKGDTLSAIAEDYGISLKTLMHINGYSYESARRMSVGSIIKIPVTKDFMYYTVKKGDTLSSIAAKYEVDVKLLMKLNGYTYESARKMPVGGILRVPLKNPQVPPKSVRFRYPVNYIGISVPFSSTHLGVDFGFDKYANRNMNIYAATSGVVERVDYSGGAGRYIRIRYDDRANNCSWYTYYKHLSSTFVRAGDKVSIGQKIAKMGSTGNSSGNHLHFDLVKTGYKQKYESYAGDSRRRYSVNPLKYLYLYKGQRVGNVTDKRYTIKRK